MPVSPKLALRLALELRGLYEAATNDLIRAIAVQVGRGAQDATWQDRKLEALTLLMHDVDRTIDDLRREVPGAVERALGYAYRRGSAVASVEAEAAGITGSFGFMPDEEALTRLLSEAMRPHEEVILGIRRSVRDAYDQALVKAAATVLTGTGTRVDAARSALSFLADQGITGFTDRSGRKWDMASYAEMVTRTSSGHAAIEGHMDRLTGLGVDTVYVSDSPEECDLCREWESSILSISGKTVGDTLSDGKKVKASVAEARSAGLYHPNCVPADTLVSAPTGVRASDSRRYVGRMIVIHTASGDELSITPNHPVLTTEGWVAAGDINVGHDLIRYDREVDRMDVMGPDDKGVQSSIGKIHHALRESSAVPSMSVPAAAEQFHGDGGDSDVEIVLADGLLQDRLLASRGDEFGDAALLIGGVRLPVLLRESAAEQVGFTSRHSSHGIVGIGDESTPVLGGHAGHSTHRGINAAGSIAAPNERPADAGLGALNPLGDNVLGNSVKVEADRFCYPGELGPLSELSGLFPGSGDSELLESLVGGGFADSNVVGNDGDGFASEVSVSQVIDVEVRDFDGHVYNLDTGGGWYTASSIVVHNCTHSQSIYLPGITEPPTDTDDADDYELRQRQRAFERRVRKWKRRVEIEEAATGKNDPHAKQARKKLRDVQAEFRQWRTQHGRRAVTQRTNLHVR